MIVKLQHNPLVIDFFEYGNGRHPYNYTISPLTCM
jgi:hypothetical protein